MSKFKKSLAFSMIFISLFLSTGAMAESSTETTVSIIGKAAPGKSITVRVTVTGKHIILFPPYYTGNSHFPGSVPGGSVDVYADGVKVFGVPALVTNSIYSCKSVYAPPFDTICYGSLTIVDYNFVVPEGSSSRVFYGKFTGDRDSHQSTSPEVTVKAVPPNIIPAINFILD